MARVSRRATRPSPMLASRKTARSRTELYIWPCARPVVVGLLIAWLADGDAVLGIALNGALQERRRQIAPAVLAASGNPAGIHAEGFEDLLLGEVADGRAEAALQRELQQDVAGVRIDMLPAGLVRSIGFPGLERFDEAGQRVACRRPRRMVVRQQKPRRVGCELTHSDAADIAARRQAPAGSSRWDRRAPSCLGARPARAALPRTACAARRC